MVNMSDTTTLNTSEETLTNLTSSLKDFQKALEKTNAQLLKQSNTLSSSKKTQEEIGKVMDEQNKKQKAINKEREYGLDILKNTAQLASNILTSTTRIGGLLLGGGLLAFSAKIVKDAIDLDNTMTSLSVRMGKGIEGVKELKNTVNGLQAEFGTSYDNAVALVSTLSEKRYTGNIYEAAAGVDLFSRATGMSNTQMAALTNEVSKAAGMSTKSTNAMYAGMLKVQQTVGLSKAGMEATTNIIPKMAANMAAFGKTSNDIKKVAAQTTALVGAMEKVGIAAGDAAELVDRLTDPDRIEDNILLYSQLGVSMEDAMSGNVDLSNMDSQLKDMAQRIVDMGPIAGSQFAKSMGMSYKQAAEMAKMEGNEVGAVADAAETSEEKALDALKQMEQITEGIGTKFETALNKAEGKIRQLPKVLLVVGTIALLALKKLVTNAWKNFQSRMAEKKQYSVMAEGVGSSISMGAQKGFDEVTTKVKTAGKGIKSAVESWFDAKGLNGVDKKIDALTEKAKKGDFFQQLRDSSVTNAYDRLNEKITESGTITDELKKKFQEVTNYAIDISETSLMDKSKKDIGVVLSETKLSIDQQKAALAIVKEISKEENRSTAYKNQKAKITKGLDKIERDILKASREVSKQEEIQQKAQANLSKLQSFNNKQKQEELNAEKKKLAYMMKAARNNAKLKAELKAQLDLKNAELKAEKMLQKENEKKIKKAQDKLENDKLKSLRAQENVAKAARDADMNIGKRAVRAVRNTAKSAGENIRSAATAKFNKSTFGSAYNAAKGAGVGKGAAIAKGAGAVGGKALKGITKGIGGILKNLGPMAIVMTLLGKVMDKIKEPLENIMDNLMPMLEPIIDLLINILGPALTKIVKALLPPILRTLGLVLKILGFILTPIKLILKALSHLPVVGKAFEGINDVLEAVTGPEMGEALENAAQSIENGSDDMSKAAKKQEDAADKMEDAAEGGPAKLGASGGDIYQVSAASSPANANSQASSTTQTTTESSGNQALKELEKQKKEKKEENWREDVKDLFKQMTVLQQAMINILSSKGETSTGFEKPKDQLATNLN